VKIHVLFDGPPEAEAGRFVEVEDEHGHSIHVGEWLDRGNGLWALVIDTAVLHGQDGRPAAVKPHQGWWDRIARGLRHG